MDLEKDQLLKDFTKTYNGYCFDITENGGDSTEWDDCMNRRDESIKEFEDSLNETYGF